MHSFPNALTSSPFETLCQFLVTITISGGSSMYLKPDSDLHLSMRCTAQCLIQQIKLYPSRLLIIQSLKLSPVLLQVLNKKVLSSCLAFKALRTSQHPGVLPVHVPFLVLPLILRTLQYLLSSYSILSDLTMMRIHCQGLQYNNK